MKCLVSLLVIICLYLVFTYFFDLQCKVAWGFSPRNEFSDFDCHFSLSRDSLNSNIVSRSSRAHFFTEFLLLSGLAPTFWSPYTNLLIQEPVRLALYMRFLLSSSFFLELYWPFIKSCLLKFTMNGSIYRPCLGSTLRCWFLHFIANIKNVGFHSWDSREKVWADFLTRNVSKIIQDQSARVPIQVCQ